MQLQKLAISLEAIFSMNGLFIQGSAAILRLIEANGFSGDLQHNYLVLYIMH